MSQLNNTEGFTPYDDMTTEELQEILRKHAHDELDEDADPQQLQQIMAVLAERRQSADTPVFRSDEDAYRDFCEHYLPRAKEGGQPGAVKPLKRLCRSVAAILGLVLVLGIVLGVSHSGSASDLGFQAVRGTWEAEDFRFEVVGDVGPVPTFPPNREELTEFDTLQEALNAHGITEDFVPTWLPEGYQLYNVNVSVKYNRTEFDAWYTKPGCKNLFVSVNQYYTAERGRSYIMKNDNPVELYESNGRSYYIFTSDYCRVAACNVGCAELVIWADVSVEGMRRIIDSI